MNVRNDQRSSDHNNGSRLIETDLKFTLRLPGLRHQHDCTITIDSDREACYSDRLLTNPHLKVEVLF